MYKTTWTVNNGDNDNDDDEDDDDDVFVHSDVTN